MERAERIRLLKSKMLTSRVIDVRFDRYAPGSSRWQVRVQLSGEVLYAFRWKKTATIVGDVVAREREMLLFVKNKQGTVKEQRDYRKPAFSN